MHTQFWLENLKGRDCLGRHMLCPCLPTGGPRKLEFFPVSLLSNYNVCSTWRTSEVIYCTGYSNKIFTQTDRKCN